MTSVSKSFGLSSSLKEEVMVIKKQGIVSILGSDCEKTKSAAAASLRRTLSADMSSKKWLSQHGFSPLKRIASSEEFPVYSSSPSSLEEEAETHQTQFHIWTSIQENNKKKGLEEENQLGQFDVWNSIISQKEQEPKNLPPPYIHPLVKRSASSLSEKSLEICTESLGSETGSDGFSSYPSSETGDAEDDQEEEEEEVEEEEYSIEDVWGVCSQNLAPKKSPPKSFPPPLASLSRGNGASLHMRPRRDNGRLFLEAVSVPSQNNFRAQRQNGRLVLTFIDDPNQEEGEMIQEKTEMGLFEVEMENFKHEDEEETESEIEEEEEEEGNEEVSSFAAEKAPKLASGLMNVHRLALMMNKSFPIANRNPTWPKKFNEEPVVNPITPLTQSLPPRHPVTRMIPKPPPILAAETAKSAAASYNEYECYWKTKCVATTAVAQKPIISNNILSKNILANEQQQSLVMRGNNGEYLASLSSKGCKEPRRSLLFWEPYCIATS